MKPKKIRKSGLQVMSLQVAGGVGLDGIRIEVGNYIEIYNIYFQTAGYLYFPEVSGARANNSIFSNISSIGASVCTVNNDFTRFLYAAGVSLRFKTPIIVSLININQVSGTAVIVQFFYKNYKP